MKRTSIITSSIGLLVSASLAQAAVVSDDFEGYTPASALGNQTYDTGDTTQQGLFTVESAVGYGGSQGVEVDTATVKSNYHHKFVSMTGVAGVVYQVSSRFQMTIDDTIPGQTNHGICTVFVSTEPEWWNGSNFGVTFERRSSGTTYGFSGIGQNTANPENYRTVGQEPNSEIGLPDMLPAMGTTATSDWFTLQLTVADTGTLDGLSRPLWDVTARVIDDAGTVLFSWTVEDRVITTNANDPNHVDATPIFSSGDTLYGGAQIPWENSNAYLILDLGGIDGLVFDDLVLSGGLTSVDGDGDGLNEAEELLLGTDDNLADTDGDSYGDKFEVDNGQDPLDPLSNPLVVVYADYSSANGYADGNLSGQEGWLGQTPTQVDSSGTGTISESGVGYIRTAHGNGALGSTGGDPGTVVRTFATDDVISIEFDYQFTLPAPLANPTLAIVGIRGETTDDWSAKQGFKLAFNQYQPSTGGAVKFWPDLNDSVNGDALILDGALFGLNGAGDPGVGDGSVDLESDAIRISYTAKCTDAGTQAWEVTDLTVTNLATSQSWTYSGPTQTFTYDDDGAAAPATPVEAFLAQQLAPNGNATFTGRSGRALYQYGSGAVDDDSDGLTQAQEMALGTSDGTVDTDGDTFSDFDEVNAMPATDPLDPADYTGAPVGEMVDFESDSEGSLSLPPWNQTWRGDMDDPTQRNLFQVVSGAGADPSKGVTLDTATAKQNYRMLYTPVAAGGFAGNVIQVSCDFKISITDTAPAENKSPIGVMLSTTSDWYDGTDIGFTLARRDVGKRFGAIMGGLGSPTGWVQNSEIGLPNTLPATGTSEMSDWFTMKLTVTDAGGGSWDVRGEIFNGSDQVLEATSTVTTIASLSSLYGGVTAGAFGTPDPLVTLTQTDGVSVDNFSIKTYSAGEDIDGDNLTQAQEVLLGTSDLLKDTDGDTFDDDVEVAAGTDPLDDTDFPVDTDVPIQIVSVTPIAGDLLEVKFIGAPGADYILTESIDLEAEFGDTGESTTTDGTTGEGTLTGSMDGFDKFFFRVEEAP